MLAQKGFAQRKRNAFHAETAEEGDIFYSGNGVVTIHTKKGGLKAVTLKNGTAIKLTLEANSTAILDSRTGEILMQQ